MTASSTLESGESRDVDPNSANVSANEATAIIPAASTSSLYRSYRPRSFDPAELVGQDHVVRTLRNAVALDRVAHAYLFCGPRGTGKTTTARILAKAVNCLAVDPLQRPCNQCLNCQAINNASTPDVIEIDAASNRGIDDIRDLRERVRFAPAQLPSKVYIVDEAHQITGAAANAFLKTLEEPPAHTRFILATTDPDELLPTIVSRCQRFDFRKVAVEDMMQRLKMVADLERIQISDEALHLVARSATGSLRDALGLLEQLALRSASPRELVGSGAINADDVRSALGLSDNERIEALLGALAQRNAGRALQVVQEALEDGEDPRQLNRQLLSSLRLLLLARSGGHAPGDDRAQSLADQFTLPELAALAKRFSDIDFSIRNAPFPQLPLEVALVEATLAESEGTRSTKLEPTPSPEPERPASARTQSLRDRVRTPTAIRETPLATASAPARAEAATITPIRPSAPPTPLDESVRDQLAAVGVEQIADLWPSVRADVKALNRRIEALLSEVDPVAIAGNQITLAVPYPFHRDKLNSDEVRDTVAGVLSRRLDRDVSIVCILRGEMAAHGSLAPFVEATPNPDPASNATPEEDELAMNRLRAAKNIFDADEIDASEIGIQTGKTAEN